MNSRFSLVWLTIQHSGLVGGLLVAATQGGRFAFALSSRRGSLAVHQGASTRRAGLCSSSVSSQIKSFVEFHNTRSCRSNSSSQRTMSSSRSDNDSNNANNNVGLSDIGSGSGDNTTTTTTTTVPSSSSWRELINVSMAKSRKVRGGNYVQISTVDPATLEPRCRTVVFRGFLKSNDGNDDVMKMITDQRSRKYGEVTTSNSNNNNNNKNTVELVWWFGKSSEQYRVRGKLIFVGSADDDCEALVRARREQWGNLSDQAREQFYWRDPETDYELQRVVPPGGRDEQGKVLQPPPDNFLLMLLYPRRVDYLRLTDNYRQIDEVLLNTDNGSDNNNNNNGGDSISWSSTRVNP